MKVYAHRAGNDLACIRPLKEAGFRTVEGDVMFARDGPIMVHPASLPKRLADGHLDYASGEVVQLLAGQGIKVPQLADMLELIRLEEMCLLLEVKVPGTIDRLAPTLLGRSDDWQGKNVAVISFLGRELVAAKNRNLATAPLMEHAPTRLVARAMVDEYHTAQFLMGQWYLDRETVYMLQNMFDVPVQVVAFTVNDLERAKFLAAIGVDAILSDKPRELVDAAFGGWLQPG